MQQTFNTVVLGFGHNTGIEVPAKSLDELGGKCPPVAVTVAGYDARPAIPWR